MGIVCLFPGHPLTASVMHRRSIRRRRPRSAPAARSGCRSASRQAARATASMPADSQAEAAQHQQRYPALQRVCLAQPRFAQGDPGQLRLSTRWVRNSRRCRPVKPAGRARRLRVIIGNGGAINTVDQAMADCHRGEGAGLGKYPCLAASRCASSPER